MKEALKLGVITTMMIVYNIYPMATRKELGLELIRASRRADFNRMQELIHEGASLNTQDQYGHTALESAVMAFGDNPDNIPCVELLINAGAELDQKDSDGQTVLWIAILAAVVNRNTRIIEVLLQAGANPNIQNNKGETPLMTATRYLYTPIINLLLAAGADPFTEDSKHNTALHYVADIGSIDTIEVSQVLIDAMLKLNDTQLKEIQKQVLAFIKGNKKMRSGAKDVTKLIAQTLFEEQKQKMLEPNKKKIVEQINKITSPSIREAMLAYFNQHPKNKID